MRGAGQQIQHGSTRLLRYRFDSTGQVPRHFHATSGRVLLFYPSLLALQPGEPVVLDVSFTASDQHCALRGTVLGREAGTTYVGCWLEFAGHGPAASLRGATANARRRQRRFPTETVVNVERVEGMPLVAKLVDVGFGGARIHGLSLKASAGDRVRLSVFSRDASGPAVRARISWARGAELGVQLSHLSPAERIAIADLVEEARRRLTLAYEATHPTYCRCTAGEAVPEPPLPRSVHRQTGSR